MIIVFSSYIKDELDFLIELTTLLGAIAKQPLDRQDKPILICRKALGDKFKAAKKNWGKNLIIILFILNIIFLYT